MALEEDCVKQEVTDLKSTEPDKNTDTAQQEEVDGSEQKELITENKDNDVPVPDDKSDKQINDDKETVKNTEEDEKMDVTEEKGEVQEENKEEIKEEEKKQESEDWMIESSEDESEGKEGDIKRRKRLWEPPVDVIVKLYEELDKRGVLELNWKCPGRKDLEQERREKEKAVEIVTEEVVVPEEKEEEPTAFDDFEEETTLVKITPRRNTGDKAQGSGRKRTAKMESILGNMMRHQKIDEDMEKGKTDTEIDPMPKSDITPRRLGKIHIRNNIDS
ncbi:PAXIP1-associated glutamate-rich protein 1-like [Antedon mediterranea]|uniref:PAXIP1-associated glutamate-rich protein 1-like n=1 Tax=Antedon mediterranea TaxID=105859 RepID=UPI003AF7C4F5